MDLGLRGKVAVVTGARQGIGKAIAKPLAREGVKVIIGEINIEKGKEVVGTTKKRRSYSYFSGYF